MSKNYIDIISALRQFKAFFCRNKRTLKNFHEDLQCYYLSFTLWKQLDWKIHASKLKSKIDLSFIWRYLPNTFGISMFLFKISCILILKNKNKDWKVSWNNCSYWIFPLFVELLLIILRNWLQYKSHGIPTIRTK